MRFLPEARQSRNGKICPAEGHGTDFVENRPMVAASGACRADRGFLRREAPLPTSYLSRLRYLLLVCWLTLGSSMQGQEVSGTGEISVMPPKSKASFHIYLLMGQSNMVGRDTAGMEQGASSPRILSLQPDGRWVVAKDPLHAPEGHIPPGRGPGMSFAIEMLSGDPNVTIGLIPCAVGGTSLKRWMKGGDLYEKAVVRAKIASAYGVISGVLWHQGEADTTKFPAAESYEARLRQMLNDLRGDLGGPELPIVVGQLGEFLALSPEKYPYQENVRTAIKHISETVPNVGYADSTELDHKGDKLHFNGKSQILFGKRYAEAMQKLSPR